MKKIKVMLSSRPKLLSEVIRNMIEHQRDMEVVSEVIDPMQLLPAVRSAPVDVVIVTPLAGNGEPKICHYLLVEYPLLIIVAQSAKADAAYLYQSGVSKKRINDPSEQAVLAAIREAVRLIDG